MKIVDTIKNKILDDISICLTKDEALQMIGYLENLIKNPSHQHSHLSSEDYKKEITLWVYDEENISKLPPKIKKLIELDEWV